MSITNIILVFIAAGMVLLVSVFYLALAPKITDLATFPRYQVMLNRKLVLKNTAILYDIRNEPFRFCPLSLQEDNRLPFPRSCILPAGSSIRLTGLKNYYNAVSRSSTIYAIGESRTADGVCRPFEYDYGTFDGKIDPKDLPELPAAAWMQ